MITVIITPITWNNTNSPERRDRFRKLADAELHFTDHLLAQIVGDTTREANARTLAAKHNPLNGLKLLGFGVWERPSEGRTVTFPAQSYSVNGEPRSFALLRPIRGLVDIGAQDRICDLILEAYEQQTRPKASTRQETTP